MRLSSVVVTRLVTQGSAVTGEKNDHGYNEGGRRCHVGADCGPLVQTLANKHGGEGNPGGELVSVMAPARRPVGHRNGLFRPFRLGAVCGGRTWPRAQLVPLAQQGQRRMQSRNQAPTLLHLLSHPVLPGLPPAPSTATLIVPGETLAGNPRGTAPGHRPVRHQHPTIARAASAGADGLARPRESRGPRHASRTRTQLNVFWRGYWLLTDRHRRGIPAGPTGSARGSGEAATPRLRVLEPSWCAQCSGPISARSERHDLMFRHPAVQRQGTATLTFCSVESYRKSLNLGRCLLTWLRDARWCASLTYVEHPSPARIRPAVAWLANTRRVPYQRTLMAALAEVHAGVQPRSGHG